MPDRGSSTLLRMLPLGLLGMRERVWGLNGSIHIGADSELGGTRIEISLPMQAEVMETALP